MGKVSFIGMKCYLDDMFVDSIEIGNNATISYGCVLPIKNEIKEITE